MPRKPTRRTKPGRTDLYEKKRRRALEVAARAFNERGFYKTSLDDVAAELNVTKAALYYYFKNKDEILFECHTAAIQQITEAPLEGFRSDGSGLEKVEEFVRRYVGMIVESFGRCLVLVGTQPLEPANAAKCRKGRRGINDLLESLVQEGIEDGSIQARDAKVSAFLIFGALNWVAQWYSEKGRLSLEDLTELAVEHVTGSLRAEPAVRPRRRSRAAE